MVDANGNSIVIGMHVRVSGVIAWVWGLEYRHDMLWVEFNNGDRSKVPAKDVVIIEIGEEVE